MILVLSQPTPGPVAVCPAPACDPTCDRCGRAAGRTYHVTPARRYCWACLDRHITNLPPKGGDS